MLHINDNLTYMSVLIPDDGVAGKNFPNVELQSPSV